MELKKYNLEPTDENVLDALCQDTARRNSDLAPFLELIDHSSISTLALNGDWGSGKTFFIKQAMMLLKWTDTDSDLDADYRAQLDSLIKNERSSLAEPTLSGPYRTVYYNAWLYDDHNDPIQSLLYFLSVTFGRQYGIHSPKAAELFSAAVQTLSKWNRLDLDALVKSLRSSDPLAGIKDMESIKFSLQEAFHDLLGDTCSLIIFIDELDRCSPAYAVKFLERVKHFFDCPKVKFVFATNLRQLCATIQSFYGANFDSTKYLNNFFDFTMELSPLSVSAYLQRQVYLQDPSVVPELCRHLISYFHLSFRDMNIFLSMADKMDARLKSMIDHDSFRNGSSKFSCVFFPPILAALTIYNRTMYDEVVTGHGESLVLDVFNGWTAGLDFASATLLPRSDSRRSVSTLQEIVQYQYRGVFTSDLGYRTVDPAGSLKDIILSIASNLY